MTHRKRQWFTALNHEQNGGPQWEMSLTETWTSQGRRLGLARLVMFAVLEAETGLLSAS
jgi:hypothetical protein